MRFSYLKYSKIFIVNKSKQNVVKTETIISMKARSSSFSWGEQGEE